MRLPGRKLAFHRQGYRLDFGPIADGLNVEYRRTMRLIRVSMLVPRAFAMIGSSAAWMSCRPVFMFATALRVT